MEILQIEEDTREREREEMESKQLAKMDGRLLEVAINGDTMGLRQLLEEDSHILDREMSKSEKEGKDNPLHIAALYGHVDFIREMLSLKWDFTRRLNSQGQSPLHLATVRGQVEVVKVILKEDLGACFVRDRDGMIPLHVAAIKGRVEVLEELVKANKTTAFVLTERGEPILHLCAKNDQKEALESLVKLVENHDDFVKLVKLKDNDDNTIFHVIIQANNHSWQALPDLLKKGKDVLDVDAKNKNGFTPGEVLVRSRSVIGVTGFIILWMLHRSGARHETNLRAILLSVLRPSDARWVTEVLLVVAVLTVSVAFQAGINPPGGFWQSTGDYNGTMYYPGQSVMSSVDPKRYRDFTFLTRITVVCSVVAIMMMISSWHSNSSPQIINHFAILFTSISISTMAATYGVALYFLSPDYKHYTVSFLYSRNFTYAIVVLNLVCMFLLSTMSSVMVWILKRFQTSRSHSNTLDGS